MNSKLLRAALVFVCFFLTNPTMAQTRLVEIGNAGVRKNIVPPPAAFTIETDASKWVVDIGSCPAGQNCFADSQFGPVGETIAAGLLSSDVLRQVDVAIGGRHSLSSGLWDVSRQHVFNFSFKDQNSPGLFHYALMYDTNGCYRQWLFNHPLFNNGHSLRKDQWYSVTASLGNQQGVDYYTQDGSSSACSDPRVFDFSNVNYFEIGIFGDSIELDSPYRFEYGASIAFDPAVNSVPELATWLTMIAGFFATGAAIRIWRRKSVTVIIEARGLR